MIGIRDDLINRAETVVGRKIRYSAISPSIFGAFDIRDVVITGDDGLPVLSVSRFRVSYSFWKLLRGKPQAIRSVRIDTPLIDLRLDRDRDIVDLFRSVDSGQIESRRSLTGLFPDRLIVRLRNGQCQIQDGRNQYRLQGLNCNAQIADARIVFDGSWTAGFSLDRIIGEPVSVLFNMRVNGAGSANLDEGNAVATISSAAGNTARTRSIAFDLGLQNNILTLRKQSDQLPFELFCNYEARSGSVAAGFTCRDLILRELLEFSGGWEAGSRWLDIAGSGTVSFNRDREGKLSYRIDLAGAAPGTGAAGAPAAFTIQAGGDEKRAVVEEFRFSMPPPDKTEQRAFQGTLGFRGSIGLEPFAPEGTVILDHISMAGTETINAQFGVSTRERRIGISANTVVMGQTELAAVSASLLPSGGDIDFNITARRLRERESFGGGRPGSFLLEGSINSGARQVEASFALDAFSAADLSDMIQPFTGEPPLPAPLRDVWRNIFITTELFCTTDFEHLLYNAPRFVIVYNGSPAMEGFFSLSGTDQRFQLTEGRFTRGGDALLVSGQAEFPGQDTVSFSMNASYGELSYYLNGRILNHRSIDIQGSHGLRIHVAAAGTEGFSGYLQGQEIPIPYRGRPAHLNFAASLRYASSKFWSLDIESFELADIASPAGPALLQIRGGANQNGASFPLLRYGDNIGPLNGRADISWEKMFPRFTGTIAMEADAERYDITGSFLEDRLDFSVSGSGMRFDRIFDGITNAFADGGIRISWESARSFRAELGVSSFRARVHDREIQASARALLDDNEFTVEDVWFNLAGFEGSLPLFRINAAEGLAETRAGIQGLAGGRSVGGTLTLDARFKPIESWLEIGNALNSFDGRVHVENLRYIDSGSAQTFDILFSRNNGAFSVSGGPRDMLRFQMDRDGNFYAGLSSPFPIRGSVIGSVNQKNIDARCNDLYIDLAELWALLPRNPDVLLTGGYVTASVNIQGSLIDPEFFGTARGSSVRIRVPRFVTQDIRPIPFTVAIEGNEMQFGPLPATVGSGAGTVNGWFRFDRWIPNIFSIDIQVPRETPIPFGFDITGFLAHGSAAGKLNLSMENLIFDISGDLYANDTELSLNSDEITQAQAAGGNLFADTLFPTVVNLNVSTGPVVEFLWPSSDFPILRATPDMGTRVRVTSDSLSRQFSVTSDIKIRGGEIFYFERSFYIRSGTLTFRENEMRFNPLLTARAEVRDRNEDGPVTISMIVDNAPLLSFNARFESNPSLSQMEIFALLGQNLTGTPQVDETTGTEVVQRALSSTADLLAQFVVIRQLERQIRNFTRLDMFSVRTQLLQNAVFNFIGLQQNPVDRIAGVGNYFDNTTVFLGKYIGQDLFVQAMLPMRYDANKTTMGGLRFDLDVGVELQNPLFTIRWDFVPTHPENWYVNDNSITVSKSWSF
jgi:hypothetical protein